MNIKEEIRRSKEDPVYFAEKFLYILTDTMQLIKFKHNTVQHKVIGRLMEQKKRTGNVRAIIVKARRQGISTCIEGDLMFPHIYLNKFTQAAIIAHEIPATNRIFEMTRRFYDFLPKELIIPYKNRNRREFIFSQLLSYLEVFTAGEKNSARSGAYTAVHGSEVAWMTSPQQLINIVQAIKYINDTIIVLESTGNGVGGYFHNTWNEAEAGNNEYDPIFIAWFESPEYKLNFKNQRVKEEFMESVESRKAADKFGDELTEMKTHNLSWEQMWWRRDMIINKCSNHDRLSPLDYFRQEYPATSQEAFITTSNCVFPISTINYYMGKSNKPKRVGRLKWSDPEERTKVEWEDDPAGDISIWHEPDPTPYVFRYRGGVDTSVSSDTGDANSIHIIDGLLPKPEVVAAWHGNSDAAHSLADELIKLDIFYNRDIFYCVEKAGLGESVMKYMFDKYNFNRFYFHRRRDKKIDKLDAEKVGFTMTAPNKVMVIDKLKKAILRGEIRIEDEDFWKECLTFVYGDRYSSIHGYKMSAMNKGKQTGSVRYYDDRIISMALAWEMHTDRFTPSPKPSKLKQPSWVKKVREKEYKNTTFMSW